MEAYLDNSATTKCARKVVETVVKAMQDDYGNRPLTAIFWQ